MKNTNKDNIKQILLSYSGEEFLKDGELLQHIVTAGLYNDLDILDDVITQHAYKLAELSIFNISGIDHNRVFDEQFNYECERLLELSIKHFEIITQLIKIHMTAKSNSDTFPKIHWVQPNKHYIAITYEDEYNEY